MDQSQPLKYKPMKKLTLRQDLEVLERRGVPLFLIRDDCGQILEAVVKQRERGRERQLR